jgi:hypothetical protein
MYSIGSKQFMERITKVFARAVKHKNIKYFEQEQIRAKPIITGVFNILQKSYYPGQMNGGIY